MSEDYDLGKSEKSVGRLYPILRDASGNVIDGFHRQNTDPDWPSITVKSVDSPVKLELARLAANFCRRTIPKSELENRIAFLIKSGMKPDEIAEQTGISKTTIYANMPQELKDKTKVEAGKLGGEVSGQLRTSASQANQTVTTQDTPVRLVECERCHVNTTQPTEWHNHQLCPKCLERAKLNPEGYDGYFRYLDKKKNGEVPQLRREVLGSKESWEQRKATMSPQHSKMEELILQKIEVKPVVTDRSFCLQSTTPDFYFPSHNLAVYLDGQPHEGREDRDETLTALLEKRHGLRVLRIKYKGTSDAEQTRVLKEIAEGAK